MRGDGAYDHLADQLDAIAEELADLGMDRLRAALEEEGSDAAQAEEKQLARARRRVLEAAEILRRA